MKQFGGKVLFLDRSDINTDEIIPAKYLTEISKDALKAHLLEDLKLEGFNPAVCLDGRVQVIVSRRNFGCGSSREHAAWVLEVNHINVVLASSFARIFRQNMFNCGMLAIELSESDIEELFARKNDDLSIEVDFESNLLTASFPSGIRTFKYLISEFDKELVRAGGWVDFADSRY